jgi:hypothetical protein
MNSMTLTLIAAFAVSAALPLTGTRTFGAQPNVKECTRAFAPLREETAYRSKLVKAASTRHASLDEVCRLMVSVGWSEIKMIKYVESNAAACKLSPHLADQLRAGHEETEAVREKICALASRDETNAPVGDFDDPALATIR